MQSNDETGADLFARLVSQQTKATQLQSQPADNSQLSNLKQLEDILMINKTLNIDDSIIPNGISNKQIIEIYGRTNVGKTELIIHLIARCLLPSILKINEDITLDLSDYSCYAKTDLADRLYVFNQMPKVILLDTDCRLSILRVAKIVEKRLKSALKQHKYSINPEMLNKLVKECLRNLVVYQCFSNEQFIFAIAACEHYIQSMYTNTQNLTYSPKNLIIPVFIDSINSDFEITDKYNFQIGIVDQNHTEKYSVILIKKLIDKYNICIIASRCEMYVYSSSANDESIGTSNNQNNYQINYSYKKWLTMVNKQIEIKKIDNETFLNLTELEKNNMSNQNSTKSKTILDKVRFGIHNDGFKIEN